MRIRLVRPYMTRPAGATLNNVPVARAKRMIQNGIAIPIDEQKGQKHVASDKKTKRRASKSDGHENTPKGGQH